MHCPLHLTIKLSFFQNKDIARYISEFTLKIPLLNDKVAKMKPQKQPNYPLKCQRLQIKRENANNGLKIIFLGKNRAKDAMKE